MPAMAKPKQKPNCKQCIQSCTPMPYSRAAVEAEAARQVAGGLTTVDQVSAAVLRALWPSVDGQTIIWPKVDGSWDPCIVKIAQLVSLQVTALAAIAEFEYQIGTGGLEGINDPLGWPPPLCPDGTPAKVVNGKWKCDVGSIVTKEPANQGQVGCPPGWTWTPDGCIPPKQLLVGLFFDDDGNLVQFDLVGLLAAAKHPCAKLSSKACRDAIKASYPVPSKGL